MTKKSFTPGTEVITTKGAATYLRYKEGNFNSQNHQVEFKNGQKHWFKDEQVMNAEQVKQVAA